MNAACSPNRDLAAQTDHEVSPATGPPTYAADPSGHLVVGGTKGWSWMETSPTRITATNVAAPQVCGPGGGGGGGGVCPGVTPSALAAPGEQPDGRSWD